MYAAYTMQHAAFQALAVSSHPASSSASERSLNKPVARVSLVQSVYQSLLEAILSGALKGGEELNEVALAAQLQVSRTPVHEALRRLAADGLIDTLPHGKSRVVTFGRDQIIALYEMRKILEGAATERSTSRIPEQRLAELRAESNQLQSIDAATDPRWTTRAISFDLHFHDVLAETSGNEFLRQDIMRHRRLVQGFCRLTGTPTNLWAAFQEHLRILEAMEARQPAAARQAMVDHIQARLITLLGLVDAQPTISSSES